MEVRRNGNAQWKRAIEYYAKSFCAWLSGPFGPQLYRYMYIGRLASGRVFNLAS